MLKANNHPESQMNRVRGVLHALLDHPIAGEWAKEALAIGLNNPVRFYKYLYSVAEACNPNSRSDISWRSKCMRVAYKAAPTESGDWIQRCKLAATFYLLSEGLYSQPTLPSLS